MLSKSRTLRASRSKPHGLLYPTPYKSLHAGSQQLRQRAARTHSRLNTPARPNDSKLLPSSCPSLAINNGYHSGQVVTGKRHSSSEATEASDSKAERDSIYTLIDKINATEAEILELLDDLDLTDEYSGTKSSDTRNVDNASEELLDHKDQQTPEARVRIARQRFGETLPEGYLNETETLLYTRLYGDPIILREEVIETDEKPEDQLLRGDGRGGWEEVQYDGQLQDDTSMVYDMEQGPPVRETDAMRRTREVAEQLGAEVMFEPFAESGPEDSTARLHPLTVEGKSSTDPSTVFPPKSTLTGPIAAILADYSNKHIAETAHRAFGGKFLPHSVRTPPARAQVPQLPIGLDATSRYMSDMEANAYLAVLYPGMYASILSVLTEVRKRLGSDWLRPLLSQEGGPSVLDASAGGAGILAWRDVLRAEYELMVPDHPKSAPYPLGRSTVVTGSDTLRLRASAMLENTTFLPRLPYYIHAREGPTLDDERAPQRKKFDVIIAPHSLLGIEEDYLRKEYVENLWALLNPNGGVLVLLEKGHQKGFEAIAGARQMLLKRYISSPGSTEYDGLTESEEEAKVLKEPGMIIAPCTNHERCPMYLVNGHTKGRKDFCHFEQRYVRPQFHQRIIDAKDRNHEDLKFSYLAVQRGVDLRVERSIAQGAEATDAAFEGYEHLNEAGEATENREATQVQSAPKEETKFHALSLPRVLYTPMKRRGHVILDLCTPSGKVERWTVPRSYSRQAYKDARKARWGDLWALGAKTRIPRSLKLGNKDGEGKKELLARRAAARAQAREEAESDGEGRLSINPASLIPKRQKGERIPSWMKQVDKKRVRQAWAKSARPYDDE